MSTREISAGGNDYRPLAPRDREQVRSSQFEFKTWCSASAELAPSPRPQAVKVLPSVARSAQQEDRALFPAIRSALKSAHLREALLNVLLIGGAVGMIVIMATIVLVVPYWVFFAES